MNKQEIQLNILFLKFQREISRAHTIFSVFFDIFLGTMFGLFGVVVGLVQIEFIPWNKFYFLLTVHSAIYVNFIISSIALFKWHHTRIEREQIIKEIKSIGKLIE